MPVARTLACVFGKRKDVVFKALKTLPGPPGISRYYTDPRPVNRNKYVRLTHCSPSTALRDLKDLVSKGILQPLPGSGRNTRYGLKLVLNSRYD